MTTAQAVASIASDIYLPRAARILRVAEPTPSERHFTLRFVDEAPIDFEPGQILEVGVMGFGEIPIGLASSPTRRTTFDIVVRSVGRVSGAICARSVGETLWVRGPLGRGFDLAALRGHDLLVVAGGIGLCPTRSLIQYVLDRRSEFGRFLLFYGTRDPQQQLFVDDLAAWRASPDVDLHDIVDRADRHWTGHVGVITSLFRKTPVDPDSRVVICGPPIMFGFVIRELDAIGIPHDRIWVDLERRMKCGVGKCGHCQINDRFCCTDGPVFAYSELEGLEEAI